MAHRSDFLISRELANVPSKRAFPSGMARFCCAPDAVENELGFGMLQADNAGT
jgi:hypothetical protein